MKSYAVLLACLPALCYAVDSPAVKAKITEAISAAPKVIAEGAAVMDWPEKPGAPSRLLRQGTNGWVCYPSMSPASHDPMCLDKQWQVLITALLNKTTPVITGVGVAYMLVGDSGASNVDPFDMAGPSGTNNWVISPPHIMIVFQDLKLLDAFPADPHTGGPWVMWKNTPYAHLMVPVSRTAAPVTPPPEILKPAK
jgi:hypothetical protein